MISYYKIPSNVNYVCDALQIKTWEKLSKIEPNIATVALIDDSLATRLPKFVVIYQNKMQTTGGSGACYNPQKKTFSGENPMDNTTMPAHMSKWEPYCHTKLLQMVIAVKYELLSKLGYSPYDEESNKTTRLPFWYWDIDGYDTIPGLIIGYLDLIGLGKADCTIIKVKKNKKQLLLN